MTFLGAGLAAPTPRSRGSSLSCRDPSPREAGGITQLTQGVAAPGRKPAEPSQAALRQFRKAAPACREEGGNGWFRAATKLARPPGISLRSWRKALSQVQGGGGLTLPGSPSLWGRWALSRAGAPLAAAEPEEPDGATEPGRGRGAAPGPAASGVRRASGRAGGGEGSRWQTALPARPGGEAGAGHRSSHCTGHCGQEARAGHGAGGGAGDGRRCGSGGRCCARGGARLPLEPLRRAGGGGAPAPGGAAGPRAGADMGTRRRAARRRPLLRTCPRRAGVCGRALRPGRDGRRGREIGRCVRGAGPRAAAPGAGVTRRPWLTRVRSGPASGAAMFPEPGTVPLVPSQASWLGGKKSKNYRCFGYFFSFTLDLLCTGFC